MKKQQVLPKGIRRKLNGRFLVDVTVGGKRKTAVTETLQEAVEVQGKLTSLLKTNTRIESRRQIDGWTLKTTYERALASVWSGTDGEKTAKINSEAALAFFGADTPIAAITVNELDRYADFLTEEGNADSTINRKMSALSTILRVAHERGQIDFMPKVPRRKEREGRIRFLTLPEEGTLLNWFNHLSKSDHREAAIVLLDTGFRCSELWRVEAQHVDLMRKTITLWRTKNKKARTIPMTERAFSIIKRRVESFPEGQLFPGATNSWFRVGWDMVREKMQKMDDKEFVPHTLRHTCCSRLVQRGVPLAHVQAWMGHKDVQTTMRYAHLAPHDLFSLAQVLEGGQETRWEPLKIPVTA